MNTIENTILVNKPIHNIKIKLIDLDKQEIIKQRQAIIILKEDSIFHHMDFEAITIEDDDELGILSKNQNNHFLLEEYKKENIVGIMVQISVSNDKWKLSIIINGSNEDIVVWYNDKDKCLIDRNIINNWLFNK